ncbi:MAG TPA: alpha/beta fold hydrolase [Acidimicrobiales bacterium]|nr:alpha/beta fold hydrolase [Acidimicrobiales bacterium]
MQVEVQVEPMRAVLERSAVADLRERLDRTRWSGLGAGVPGGAVDWRAGVPLEWLRDLVDDWRRFDVDGFQGRLDALEHIRCSIGGRAVHAIRCPGAGPHPTPLVLTHGWPGSCLEYLDLIGPLTDPGRHGGDPARSFDVIVPSLPGFGWSAPPPPGGLVAAEVAGLWHRLVTEGLGYRRYAAHGSDLGAGVTAWLARLHPDAVTAIHLATPGLGRPPQPWSAEEAAHFAEVDAWSAEEGGYSHQHATKPATLAAALADSPAGLAAWIGEKVVAWSSRRPDGGPAFDRDLLLGTLTLYWATGTIGTSLLPYLAYRRRPDAALPADRPGPVPTAVSIFGGERVPFPKPPRRLAERYFDVTAWAEHDIGGHFPAVAEPALLARTLGATLAV